MQVYDALEHYSAEKSPKTQCFELFCGLGAAKAILQKVVEKCEKLSKTDKMR